MNIRTTAKGEATRHHDTIGAPAAAEARWRSVEDAAAFLGMPVRVLRQTLASNARMEGGLVEARLDDILARKLGRRWRVWLGEKWTAPEPAGRTSSRQDRPALAISAGHGGKDMRHGTT